MIRFNYYLQKNCFDYEKIQTFSAMAKALEPLL